MAFLGDHTTRDRCVRWTPFHSSALHEGVSRPDPLGHLWYGFWRSRSSSCPLALRSILHLILSAVWCWAFPVSFFSCTSRRFKMPARCRIRSFRTRRSAPLRRYGLHSFPGQRSGRWFTASWALYWNSDREEARSYEGRLISAAPVLPTWLVQVVFWVFLSLAFSFHNARFLLGCALRRWICQKDNSRSPGSFRRRR